MISTRGIGRGAAGNIAAFGMGRAVTVSILDEPAGKSARVRVSRLQGLEERDLLEMLPIIVEVLNGQR